MPSRCAPVTVLGNKLCARGYPRGAPASKRNSSKEMIRDDVKDLGAKVVAAMQLVLKRRPRCPPTRTPDSYVVFTTRPAHCPESRAGRASGPVTWCTKPLVCTLPSKKNSCGQREPTAGRMQEEGMSHIWLMEYHTVTKNQGKGNDSFIWTNVRSMVPNKNDLLSQQYA